MSKRIGNKNLTDEALKGLKGFEDVFEDYVESEEYKELTRREGENFKKAEPYELQYFLEQENARLTALENFFTKKIPLKKNFSQTEKLIHQQQERKTLIKERLNQELKKLDSTIQKNLSHIFNSHFS